MLVNMESIEAASFNSLAEFGSRLQPTSSLLSVKQSLSCGNTPILYHRITQESHLSRLAVSIKFMLQENGLHDQYFQPDVPDSCGTISILQDTLQSEQSLADKADYQPTHIEDPGDKLDPAAEIDTQDIKFEFNPEKANLWKELTNIDVSPVLPQRKSRTFCESARQVLNKIDPSSLQRYPLNEKTSFEGSPAIHKRCEKQTKDPNLGSLKFKFQYLIVTERLKVTVINTSNMFKCGKVKDDAYTYAEVCLMPGKIQRQLSKFIKVSSDTVFDFVVYFHRLSLFEMHQMCLRIKIMTKERLLRTPKVVGEVTVALDDFDLVSETVLDESFNTRIGSRSGSRYGVRTILVK